MSRARTRLSKKANPIDWKGVTTVAVGLVLIIGIGAAYFYKSATYTPTDKNTFCQKDTPPPTATVILLDATDKLSAVQKQSIAARILAEVRDPIPRYGALQLYSVGPIGETLLKPHFSLCNPGRGKEIDPLWGNPRMVEKKWQEGFSSELNRVLSRLLAMNESETSPIMEAIQSVSVTTFLDNFRDAESKKLIIISDMIHNTPDYSQYQTKPDFDKFKTSPYFLKVRPHLKGVDVEVFYIRRTTRASVQGKTHIGFWDQFIAASGGALIRVVSIDG